MADKVIEKLESKPTYLEAAKVGLGKSVLVTQLEENPQGKLADENALDNFLANTGTKPNYIKKKDGKLLPFFNSDNERSKAKEVLEKEKGAKNGIKAITEQKGFFPVVVLGIGHTDPEELRQNIEERNPVLKGRIADVRTISKEKGHVRINMKSREAKESILSMKRINIKATNGFERFRVVPLDPLRAVRRCFKCQEYGHIATYCKKSLKCGKCAENHSARECAADREKCVNCLGKHKSGHFDCPEHKKASEKYRAFLESQ